MKALGLRYGLKCDQVSYIVRGIAWKEIPDGG
jgi:hypothetical protein